MLSLQLRWSLGSWEEGQACPAGLPGSLQQLRQQEQEEQEQEEQAAFREPGGSDLKSRGRLGHLIVGL